MSLVIQIIGTRYSGEIFAKYLGNSDRCKIIFLRFCFSFIWKRSAFVSWFCDYLNMRLLALSFWLWNSSSNTFFSVYSLVSITSIFYSRARAFTKVLLPTPSGPATLSTQYFHFCVFWSTFKVYSKSLSFSVWPVEENWGVSSYDSSTKNSSLWVLLLFPRFNYVKLYFIQNFRKRELVSSKIYWFISVYTSSVSSGL